jgi:hypothetical protein
MGRASGQSRLASTHPRAKPLRQRNVLYFRHGYEQQLQQELGALQERFTVIDDLEQIEAGDRVLCRFSTLPFPELLEQELEARGAVLIHGHAAHAYLADMRRWYPDLKGITPETWFAIEDVSGEGPFFVKGMTNSNKSDWRACYAADREDLQRVIAAVAADPLLSQQPLCIRQFVPLVTYAQHPQTGVPITEEFRCFVAGGRVLSRGYYWSEQLEQLADQGIVPDPEAIPDAFLEDVIARVHAQADYYVVDVARTQAGEWLVVELNDATMSGLAGNDPQVLYSNFLAHLE